MMMDLLLLVLVMFAVLGLLLVYVVSYFDKQIIKMKVALKYVIEEDNLIFWISHKNHRNDLNEKEKMIIDFLELNIKKYEN